MPRDGISKSRPSISAESAGTVRKSVPNARWFPHFAPIFHALGRIIMEVDEYQYDIKRAIFLHWAKLEDLQHIISSHHVSSRCCYSIVAILVLRYRYRNDPPGGRVAKAVFRDFTGRLLGPPDLNAAIPFQPSGNVILLHSAVLEHYITLLWASGTLVSSSPTTLSLLKHLDISRLAIFSRLVEE